jgi:hypothetical protein
MKQHLPVGPYQVNSQDLSISKPVVQAKVLRLNLAEMLEGAGSNCADQKFVFVPSVQI